MNRGHASTTSSNAAATLSWWVEAGVDTLVGEKPSGWLSRPESAPAAPAASPVRTTSTKPARAATPNAAEALAAAADGLVALSAAVADFDHPLRAANEVPRLIEGNVAPGVLVIADFPDAAGSEAALLRDKMLAAIGLDLESVAVAHMLPWPTPGGRGAAVAEVAAFAPFLRRAVALAAPRVILAFGAAAATLSGERGGIASLRGRWLTLADTSIPLIATFHPRVLDNRDLKKLAWADLQAFQARIAETR